MKILLTDASGLTSRQVSTILFRKHHSVHVLSPPSVLSLTKLSRSVRQSHIVPPFGEDPYIWLDACLAILRTSTPPFDVLICTQEQVAVLAAEIEKVKETGVKIAVPEFKSLRRVMGKIDAGQALAEAGLPQPESIVVQDLSPDELIKAESLLPAYIKSPIGTASTGVRHVKTSDELATAIADFVASGAFALDDGNDSSSQLLVQKEIPGPLLMVSAVFSHGRLLAWHSCIRLHEGVGGGASKKVSLPLKIIETHLQALGSELEWHGALSLDAILRVEGGKETVWYIDVNPRIVEPMNGLLAGVDLVDALLQVSLGTEGGGNEKEVVRHGIEGVQTHQLILALMESAERGRVWLLVEVFKAVMQFDMYAGSTEELTPVGLEDVWSVLVLIGLVMMLFVGGRWSVERLKGGAVRDYALSPMGWRMICAGKRS